MESIKDKIKASLFLASFLDTIGFKNSQWEFNYNINVINEKIANIIWLHIIHEYNSLGGLKNIDISKWIASDDTIMMIATAKACLKGGKFNHYLEEYKRILSSLEDPKRVSGITTIDSLRKIIKMNDLNKFEYSSSMGGNGAAMRTSAIGLIYYKDEDIDKLIEESILSSRLTHNYSMGFLGGLVTALFTSYAVRNIEPWKWSTKMMKLVNSGKIDEIIKNTNIWDKYSESKDIFWDRWFQYNENRLPKLKYKSRSFRYPPERISELKKYTPGVNYKNSVADYGKWGSSGIGAVIIAYDSILMSLTGIDENGHLFIDQPNLIKYNLESMIFFSTLHFGDNDTTGTIAGAWYGALRGFEDLDKDKIKCLEFYQDLNKISDDIIKKIN